MAIQLLIIWVPIDAATFLLSPGGWFVKRIGIADPDTVIPNLFQLAVFHGFNTLVYMSVSIATYVFLRFVYNLGSPRTPADDEPTAGTNPPDFT